LLDVQDPVGTNIDVDEQLIAIRASPLSTQGFETSGNASPLLAMIPSSWGTRAASTDWMVPHPDCELTEAAESDAAPSPADITYASITSLLNSAATG